MNNCPLCREFDFCRCSTTPLASPPQEGLDLLVEEFVGWWFLNREGSANAAYDYIDKMTKRLREALAASRPQEPTLPKLTDIQRICGLNTSQAMRVQDYIERWLEVRAAAPGAPEQIRGEPLLIDGWTPRYILDEAISMVSQAGNRELANRLGELHNRIEGKTLWATSPASQEPKPAPTGTDREP